MIKEWMLFVAVGLLFSVSHAFPGFSSFRNSGSCGLLSPPPNAVMSYCTRGARRGSRCTIRCDEGFRQEQTTRNCRCLGLFCSWGGNNPRCEEQECRTPDSENGHVIIVDKWPNGFAGVIEFERVPRVLSEGWSVVIVFNKNLGPRARMSSWSAAPTSVSDSYNSFTLSNIQREYDSNSSSTTLKSLFVVTGISGEHPTKGYIGLYHQRIVDATCYQPTSPLPSFETMNSRNLQSRTTTTEATTTSTASTTTTSTTASSTTTPEHQHTSTESATSAASSSTFSTTSREASTTSPTTTTTASTMSTTTTTANPLLTREQVDQMRCIYQRGSKSYRTQKSWQDNAGSTSFSGNALAVVPISISNWMVVITFQRPILNMQVWNTISRGGEVNGTLWKLGPQTFNRDLNPGELDVNFIAQMETASSINPLGEVYLCALEFTEGDPIRLYDENGMVADAPPSSHSYSFLSTTSTVATTTTVSGPSTTYRPNLSARCQRSSPAGTIATKPAQSRPKWRRSTDGTAYNYNEVLAKSIFFYEAQRSGYLPPKYKRVPWRGNSMLKDGCPIGVDLSRGWFDAGDYCKFTFPMASAVTTLAWGGIEFRSAYRSAGIMIRFLGSVRWPVEWLINAHVADNELVALIGNVQGDHSSWGRAEDWNQDRPVYTVTSDRPGSEVAAETAAALASAAILMKRSHPALVKRALQHAKTLYTFAKTHRGNYHESIPEVREFYRSASGYVDELIWSAAWLYKATGNQTYLADAERLYTRAGGPYLTEQEYSWDSKMIGAQVLLANLTGQDQYRSGVIRFLDAMIVATTTSTSSKKTPQGMLWIRAHGPNRYAANAAMMALLACKLEPALPKREIYWNWARTQIHLLLGDAGRSYVVGFGRNYPTKPHHRSSSCPPPPARCDWTTYSGASPNHFLLFGALVGGPNLLGHYTDSRENYQQSEVAVDYNAGFQSAVAGLKYFVTAANFTVTATSSPLPARG